MKTGKKKPTEKSILLKIKKASLKLKEKNRPKI